MKNHGKLRDESRKPTWDPYPNSLDIRGQLVCTYAQQHECSGRTESFLFPFLSQGNFGKFWKETFPRIFKNFPRFGKRLTKPFLHFARQSSTKDKEPLPTKQDHTDQD